MPQNQELTELIADVKEQVLYLQELGVETLNVELPEVRVSLSKLSGSEESRLPKTVPGDVEVRPPAKAEGAPLPAAKQQKAVPRAGARLAALPSLSKRKPADPVSGTMAEKDDTTQIKAAAAEPSVMPHPTPEDTLFGEIGPALPESADTIESIRAEIGNCTRCPLFEGRTQVVHTTGNFNADLMFIGEAPGADEDAQGFPFVGRAGQLLTKIIESIGLKREEVAIGNINRCRPPGNRAPTLPEAHTCRPFLLREIAVIRPKVIVVMGNTALHNLLDTKAGITRVRGTFQDYFGVKVMPTFHPAYLLRDPHKKREVWEDMKMVRNYLNSLAS